MTDWWVFLHRKYRGGINVSGRRMQDSRFMHRYPTLDLQGDDHRTSDNESWIIMVCTGSITFSEIVNRFCGGGISPFGGLSYVVRLLFVDVLLTRNAVFFESFKAPQIMPSSRGLSIQ
jgi:hypothetical protein